MNKKIGMFCFAIFFLLPLTGLQAQEKTASSKLFQDAMGFKPVQPGVVIDIPTPEELGKCEMKLLPENKGFAIYGPGKEVLRMFLDTAGNGKVDQWSYYRGGVEVYRDSDNNGNGKADNFRWFHSGGTRWGVDANEDGVIDFWKQISPEEVSSEIVAALAQNDLQRFMRVALTQEQLTSLQLGETLHGVVAAKMAKLQAGFAESAKAINLSANAEWFQFGGSRPGTVPVGREGNKKDLVVYENGMAAIREGSDNKQIAIGTLVQIGPNCWRTIDLPRSYDDGAIASTFIPSLDGAAREAVSPDREEVFKLINEFQDLQASLTQTPPEKRAAVHDQITRRILGIIRISPTPEDRDLWMRQLADAIMVAVQAKEYPDGTKNLDILFNNINKGDNKELAAYVKSRYIMTLYYAAIGEGADALKAQVEWLENLEKFAEEFEKTEAGIEGMLQLASYREMVDQTEEALKWYKKVIEVTAAIQQHKELGLKAAGAVRRLGSVGEALPFRGLDAQRKTIDIEQFKGSPVLLYFWDTRSTHEIAAVAAFAEKNGLKVIGINLDTDPEEMKRGMVKNAIKWPTIFEPGGLEAPAALYWGVQTTPMMILYDKEGKVVAQNIPSVEALEKPAVPEK